MTIASEAGGLGEFDLRAQILALRQVGDQVGALVKRLDGLADKVDDVRERLVKLEVKESAPLIEAVRQELKSALARIDALEAQRDRVVGAAAFWTWLSRNVPWMLGALGAFMAGLGFERGGGK